MMTIREQKEAVEKNIGLNENLIDTLKSEIKADKAKLKKMDKIEKELSSIFGEPEDNVVPFPSEEIPRQVTLNEVENVG